MFADVNNVRDVISNCQRKFKLIQHKKKNFNSGNGNFWYSILSRCNQIITENCNHPTRGHWMKWSSIGWHSESVGGGQHGGWGCDVWRARFFQMLYVWQPALYCEKVRRRGKTTLRVRIRNIKPLFDAGERREDLSFPFEPLKFWPLKAIRQYTYRREELFSNEGWWRSWTTKLPWWQGRCTSIKKNSCGWLSYRLKYWYLRRDFEF